MPRTLLSIGTSLPLAAALALAGVQAHADELEAADFAAFVDGLAEPLTAEHDVPGMAVAIVSGGERRLFAYGVTAPGGDRPVSERTLFEIGSLSKTFTATLGAYGEATGELSMDDTAASLMPELEGSPVGGASLLDLATYAAGGLPLQFPDAVAEPEDMVAYYRGWRPEHEAGTTRLYSNPSIGLFGHLAASGLEGDFTELMETRLLPAFGLRDTFLDVPDERMEDYAFGLARDGGTVRVNPGTFDAQAYGIKTTASDLLRFVELNIDPSDLDDDWRQAVAATQEPRYRVGPMMQGLGWEIYGADVALDELLSGNATEMALEPNAIEPAGPDAAGPFLINKTGSTGGFGAYAAFVPSEGIGVALLANRNVPIPARVTMAHAILERLR